MPDQFQETSARGVVFVVPAEVIGQAANTLGEKRHLHFRGAGVARLALVLSDDALLGGCVQHVSVPRDSIVCPLFLCSDASIHHSAPMGRGAGSRRVEIPFCPLQSAAFTPRRPPPRATNGLHSAAARTAACSGNAARCNKLQQGGRRGTAPRGRCRREQDTRGRRDRVRGACHKSSGDGWRASTGSEISYTLATASLPEDEEVFTDMTPPELFENAMDWLREHYGEYRFFAERDVVWTVQKRIMEEIQATGLSYRVFNDHTMPSGAHADLVILADDGSVVVAAEFKYEPSHGRSVNRGGDISPTKFPVAVWADIGNDVQRIRQYVELDKAELLTRYS